MKLAIQQINLIKIEIYPFVTKSSTIMSHVLLGQHLSLVGWTPFCTIGSASYIENYFELQCNNNRTFQWRQKK